MPMYLKESKLPHFKSLAIFSNFETANKNCRPRMIGKHYVDKSIHWSFFNGHCQGASHICTLGFIHFFFKGNVDIGSGTNNLREFKTLINLVKDTLLDK